MNNQSLASTDVKSAIAGEATQCQSGNAKVIVTMPAYNAADTLLRTFEEIPKGTVSEFILVDDCSQDDTVEVGKSLDIKVIKHPHNVGYGGNQKTCYLEALRDGADIVIMLHPDYQYDPRKIPDMIAPILSGNADIVLGSRLLGGGALKGGIITMSAFIAAEGAGLNL